MLISPILLIITPWLSPVMKEPRSSVEQQTHVGPTNQTRRHSGNRQGCKNPNSKHGADHHDSFTVCVVTEQTLMVGGDKRATDGSTD